MVLTPEIAAGILTAVKEEYRMICGMTYFQICLYFLFYSFGGWVVEVIFHAVTLGKVINRGFLNGPVCPVYGFGVLSVFALLNTLQSGGHQMSEGMIFLFGIVSCNCGGAGCRMASGCMLPCKMVGLFK